MSLASSESLRGLLADSRWAEAISLLGSPLTLEPEIQQLLAVSILGLLRSGDPANARRLARGYVRQLPTSADARLLHAEACTAANEPAIAMKELRCGLSLRPNGMSMWRTLGQRLRATDPSTAIRYLEFARHINPGDARARRELALALAEHSHLARFQLGAAPALEAATRATVVDPDCGHAWSAKLFARQCLEDQPSTELFEDAVRAAQSHALGIERLHVLRRSANFPLNVGFRALDLHDSSVRHFIAPILANHDPARLRLTLYDQIPPGPPADYVGALPHIRQVDTRGLDDDALADRIQRDQIDVLIDLIGHGRYGQGLGLLARKPAPSIISYCGYLGTLGLDSVEWFFSDDVIHPPVGSERYVETLLKLPHWLCYAPPRAPDPVDRPSHEPIVFCSFNQLGKLSDHCLTLWARVLNAVPASRLLIKRRDMSTNRTAFLDRLASLRMPLERLDFLTDEDSHDHHLASYGKADIALDTLPYNGATTVCEALWMGLPVVVRSGGTAVSRMSRCILAAADLEHWAAEDDDGFVATAMALASDHALRSEFRRTAREKLLGSPLCDGPTFSRSFEDACYRAFGCGPSVPALVTPPADEKP